MSKKIAALAMYHNDLLVKRFGTEVAELMGLSVRAAIQAAMKWMNANNEGDERDVFIAITDILNQVNNVSSEVVLEKMKETKRNK